MSAHPGGTGRQPNRLLHETSPYLRQHAHNPVDWYPWGEEALLRSRAEDRPIFLSIGYSACHWCHVMERESFEDPSIAALLNEGFVNIKVDREERPDLDELYMSAVQLLTGQGGWPMSVWLTPDLKPFYGGTYFPPDDRYGRPGFPRVLEAVLEAYRDRRQDLEQSAEEIHRRVAALSEPAGGGGKIPGRAAIDGAVAMLKRSLDAEHGGFGGAPKFPHPMGIRLLLRAWERTADAEAWRAATVTLDHMANGGIYDHLGGGFHRYSTDVRWLVPHFEKMLYDQALLLDAYTEAWQTTRSPLYERVVRETIAYIEREMTSPEGVFYSALDADSEGHEGRFYVWTPEEVAATLGPDEAALFGRAYDVDEGGNFEGRSIPHPIKPAALLAGLFSSTEAEIAGRLQAARERLRLAREKRPRPALDDKTILAWNALLIAALARAGNTFGEDAWTRLATRTADFILDRMRDGTKLLRVYKDGRARVPAFLEDYANFLAALTALYEATFDERWLREGLVVAEAMSQEFGDADGGFFNTRPDPDLIVRVKSAQDGSTPSGNSMAATALLRLGRLTGRSGLLGLAEGVFRRHQDMLEQYPAALHQMMLALDEHAGPRREFVLAGSRQDSELAAAARALGRRFLPRAIVVRRFDETEPTLVDPELLDGKLAAAGQAAIYACADFTCGPPLHRAADLKAFLDGEEASPQDAPAGEASPQDAPAGEARARDAWGGAARDADGGAGRARGGDRS